MHHVREGQGIAQRAANWLVIPLCPACHGQELGGKGVHGDKSLLRIYEVDEMSMLVNKEMEVEPAKCRACGKENKGTKTQWWYLSGYYGLSGFVCSACFEKVAHRNGKPNHPAAYRNIIKKANDCN